MKVRTLLLLVAGSIFLASGAAQGSEQAPDGSAVGSKSAFSLLPTADRSQTSFHLANWRYRWYNNRWWYYQPDNSWVYWYDNRWMPYYAPRVTYYNGYYDGYYGNYYGGNYGGYYPYYPRAYRSYRYGSYYRPYVYGPGSRIRAGVRF